MKATSYEPGKMVVKDEHFDTSSTLTLKMARLLSKSPKVYQAL